MESFDKYTLKRGGTFEAKCRIRPTGGLPNLQGVSISAAIRTANASLYPAVVNIPDANGVVFIVTVADTSQFWLGPAYWDIKFVKNGKTFYTKTIEMMVERSITP